jgi:GNAT superfamily N-acetyltransferase
MFEDCVKPNNLTLGVYDGNKLIAVSIMYNEKGSEEDLSLDLKKFTPVNSANYKLVLVDEEYRGINLQKALIWIMEKYAYNIGLHDLCTTVSPDNQISLQNVLEMGFQIDHKAIKYNNFERVVFYKNIYNSVSNYNNNLFRIIRSLEGKENVNDFILEGINFDRCFQGELQIMTSGDIVQYTDNDTGNDIFGVYMINTSPYILIYLPSCNKLCLINFSEKIESLVLKKVWINTLRI